MKVLHFQNRKKPLNLHFISMFLDIHCFMFRSTSGFCGRNWNPNIHKKSRYKQTINLFSGILFFLSLSHSLFLSHSLLSFHNTVDWIDKFRFYFPRIMVLTSKYSNKLEKIFSNFLVSFCLRLGKLLFLLLSSVFFLVHAINCLFEIYLHTFALFFCVSSKCEKVNLEIILILSSSRGGKNKS